MHSGRTTIFLLLCGCILMKLQPAKQPATAQFDPIPLPADLIFTVPESPDLSWAYQPHNRLVHVDAETLEISPFYTDAAAIETRALGWSPQGTDWHSIEGSPQLTGKLSA
jgi:hypothetical protein